MSYSSDNTFEKILNRMLSNEELSNIDKRVGSVIYDSLAPCAMELAEIYAKLDILQKQTYLITATGVNLDNRVYDYGVIRSEASYSQRVASFKKYEMNEEGERILVNMEIPVGSRFTTPENSNVTFAYLGKIENNEILQCEQIGSIGNEYIGMILPLNPIKDLAVAEIIGTYKPGEDIEDDESLRTRGLDSIRNERFGGNIPDYIDKINSIDGVGNTKVFPAWKFNGSVLLSVVDPQFNPIDTQFINNIKEQVDPDEYTGKGYGIAPIGHYVTITTPSTRQISVKVSVELEQDVSISEVEENLVSEIEKYFEETRKEFGQDKTLAIYKARITDCLFNVPEVLNVTNVLLDDLDADIVMVDYADLNYQYLPYLKEVIFV